MFVDPTGIDVPFCGYYIVRPCVNALGLGLGAKKVWLEKNTTHPPWDIFGVNGLKEDIFPVDYKWGNPNVLC